MDEWLKYREETILSQRQQHLTNMCRKFNLSTFQSGPKFDFNNFVISHQQKLLSCLLNKVGSSSFVFTFLALKGVEIKEVKSPHSRINEISAKVIWN